MPDDITHAAETCARQVADALGAHLNIAATRIIERALREERERCAKIAESDINPCPQCNYACEVPDYRAKGIAEAIRKAA